MGTNSKLKSSTRISLSDQPLSAVSELATLDSQTGRAPRNRLKDANAFYRLYVRFVEADRKSAHNRALLQDMVDGAPPQSDHLLRQVGRGWEYNLNFLAADARMAGALVTYDDLVDSQDELIIPELKPKVVPPEDMQEVIDVIAEEHAKLVREQSDFYSVWQILAKEFVGHGVGFTYYPDGECWKYEAAGWNEMKMPRKTRATEDAVPVLIWAKAYRVDELYQFISDPEYAVGWNRTEVQKAIVKAAGGQRDKKKTWYDQWPLIEMELKNNDYGFGLADAEEVNCIQGIVREFDGKYSFYIGLETGDNKDFLYQDKNRYENANQAFTAFTLGVGNGTFHSIRGLLWKMFPGVQANNRLRNSLLNQTAIGMSLILQPQDGEALDDVSVTFMGSFASVAPGLNVIENKFPDVGTQALPVIKDMEAVLDNATSQFQSISAPTNQSQQGQATPYQTKYQYQSQQGHSAALSNNSVNRFCRSLDKLFAEQFRRIQAIGSTGITTKDGCKYPEIKEFYERCSERGVTSKMIKAVRKVKAMRAIGNGSPQLRQLHMDRNQQRLGAFDETGRNLAIRDSVSLDMGRQYADRYLPKQKRIAPDAEIAMIENAALNAGDVEVLPDQNHAVHASVHVPKLLDVIQQLVGIREQNPEADFTPLRPMVDWAGRLHDHSAKHVQAMAVDPLRQADMKSYNAALEQAGNLLAGFARELQAQERHAVESQQPDQTKQQEVQIKAQEGQQKLQQSAQEGQQALQQKADNDQQARFDKINESVPRLQMEAERDRQELRHNEETHALEQELASAKVAQVAQQTKLNQQESNARIKQQQAKNQNL